MEPLIDIRLVDVAPAPAFSWFDGSHERMPGFVEVRRGMAIPGGIATANLAALQAHAQVDPGISGLETLLATLGARLHLLHMIFCVRTLCRTHEILFPFDVASAAKVSSPPAVR
jgi:hypothetical protein